MSAQGVRGSGGVIVISLQQGTCVLRATNAGRWRRRMDEPRVITLTVPEVPNVKALGANARRAIHYWNERELVKADKEWWYALLLPEFNRQFVQWAMSKFMWPIQKAKLSFDITFPTKTLVDYLSIYMALKGCEDVLCAPKNRTDNTFRLGLIQDDNPKCLVESPKIIPHYEKGVKRTVITIEEVVTVNEEKT